MYYRRPSSVSLSIDIKTRFRIESMLSSTRKWNLWYAQYSAVSFVSETNKDILYISSTSSDKFLIEQDDLQRRGWEDE